MRSILVFFLIILAASACKESVSGNSMSDNSDSVSVVNDTLSLAKNSNTISERPVVQIPDSIFYLTNLEREISSAFEFAKSIVFDTAYSNDKSSLTGFDFCTFKEQRKSNNLGYRIHRDSSGRILMIEQDPLKNPALRLLYYIYTPPTNSRFRFMFPVKIRYDGSAELVPRTCILNDSLHNKTLYLEWNTIPNHSLGNLAIIMMLDCDNLDAISYAGLENGGFRYFAKIKSDQNRFYKRYYQLTNFETVWKLRLNDLYKTLDATVSDSSFTRSELINGNYHPLWLSPHL